ncbi:grancalcin-like [Huso huso]|uniref:Grancalcin-like n=1 Tax=Huso huso TaxID=61971 RepID=A0ABR0ZE53_HUSHU|nr:grancalcin-like [Acipenser ruthenus]
MSYPGYGGHGGYGAPMPGAPTHGMQMVAGPGGYQAYGAYPGSFSGAPVNDPMWSYFTAVAGQDGEIDSEELQRCLTQTGISGSYSPFSIETCRIMIAMLDRDMTSKMGFNEFKELFGVLNVWKQNFMMFDQDRSGTVEPHEMSQAVLSMGYRISAQTLNGILKRYSKNGRIFFDDYVACCVKLRALTETFKRRDNMQQGVVNFPYDDFIMCTMAI